MGTEMRGYDIIREMGRKRGKLIGNRAALLPEEAESVDVLRQHGYNVELVPQSRTPGHKTPDFKFLSN